MIVKREFGSVYGKPVYEYVLSNKNQMNVGILTYGATLRTLNVPGKDGRLTDVICGYDDIKSYVEGDGYQGAVVGRYANRIAKGRFTLDGEEYSLFINNGVNSLHGGEYGLNTKLFAVCENDKNNSIVMTAVLEDMEEGYPGRMMVEVTYTLTDDNALKINYRAKSDKKTIINLTNHSYFNLSGYASGSVLYHTLRLDADSYIPTDDTLIPTGEIKSVDGTPFDFRTEKRIGQDFYSEDNDLKIAGGYDHCLNFIGGETEEPVLRAELKDAKSGRVMKVYTDQPCVQLYTANFMNNSAYPFKGGFAQHTQNAVCLETQHMPDSINHDGFTNVVLDAGEEYNYTTVFAFELM
ncbi:MAG: galactose mutarotase [Ruminococcaceae bacterium]|nr:galactose mutarotase [Oscillospiraceae bacterium]